ncbi:hypothetical protein ABIB35_000001, partial [Arthrobacter sp. UYP6]|uniref:hypothetical protein n=1 Tax=Arthrobacter sp. UYP6 TaxID=1756378 RepID=UPI003393DDD5
MYYFPAVKDGSNAPTGPIGVSSPNGAEGAALGDPLEALEAAERVRLIDEIRLLEELKCAVAAAQACAA